MSTPRKIRCSVTDIVAHGDEVYTLQLVPERPVPAFSPGQFLHLALDEYDPSGFWPESRVFSIASSPRDRGRVSLCYSVKGAYTARMAKELCVGRSCWIKLPYGEFVVDGAADAVLIAGGTGITAFRAFIEGLAVDHARRVVLLYGARRPELLIGRDVIEGQEKKVGTLHAFLFTERGAGERILPGCIRLDILRDCPVDASAVYYLAGPPPMVAAFSAELGQGGVSTDRIRVDAWE